MNHLPVIAKVSNELDRLDDVAAILREHGERSVTVFAALKAIRRRVISTLLEELKEKSNEPSLAKVG